MLKVHMYNSLQLPWELGKWETFKSYGTEKGHDGEPELVLKRQTREMTVKGTQGEDKPGQRCKSH